MDNLEQSKPRRRRRSRLSPWSFLRRWAELAGTGLERVCLFSYLLILVLFPLAMGGRELWAQPLALGGLVAILAIVMLAGALRGWLVFRWYWSSLFFLVPLGVSLLQGWPSAGLARLAPATWQAWASIRDLGLDVVTPSLSLSPVETWRQSLFFLLLGLAYFLGLNLFRRRRDVFLLAGACIVAAVVNAVVGFYPEFTGSNPWYWQLDVKPGTIAGTFLNRNHFSCLMSMGILTSLGLLFGILSRRRRFGEGFRNSGWVDVRASGSGEWCFDSSQSHHPRIVLGLLLGLALFIMVIAQVFSLSRGGLATMLPLAICFFLLWLYRGPRQYQKRHVVASFIILAGAGIFASFEAAGRLYERYASLAEDGREQLTMGGRLLVWNDILPMLKTWWITGVGAGAFANASPRFESGWALDYLAMHAHNDWLEALVEFGVPVAGGLMLAALLWLSFLGWCLRRQPDTRLRWLGFGTMAAIVAVLLHELVDYSLQAPAVALVFTALLTVLVRCTEEPSAKRGIQNPEVGSQNNSTSPIPDLQSPLLAPLVPEVECTRTHTDTHGHTRMPANHSGQTIRTKPYTRIFLALLAMAGLWWSAAYTWQGWHYGRQAAHFRDVTSSLVLRDRQLGERDDRYFISLADSVLQLCPADLEILRARAVWRQRLALLLTERMSVDPSVKSEIQSLFASSREDLRVVCGHYPTNGYYQLFYAQLVEQCAWITGDKGDEARIEAIYDLAHRNFPTLAGVTRSCAQYYWRSYQRLQASRAEPKRTQAQLDKALAVWREAISQDPASIAKVLPLIWQVEPSVARLRGLTPDKLVSQEALFVFLMAKRKFAEAMATLETLEKLNRTRPTAEDIETLSVAERYRLDRRSRADVDQWVQEQKLIVFGLMENWPARNQEFAAYQLALDKVTQQDLDRLQVTTGSDDLHQRELVLQRMLQRNPWALAPRIPLAEARYVLGKPEEATAILMPLVYQDGPVPASLLEATLTVLQKWAPVPPKNVFSRQAFLKLALRIRLAEATTVTTSDRQAMLEELTAQEELVLRNPYNVWIQQHLIPYYAGRLHELAGQAELAAAAYQRCLAISPNNLFAKTRLAAVQLQIKNYKLRIKDENGNSLVAPSLSLASDGGQGIEPRTRDSGLSSHGAGSILQSNFNPPPQSPHLKPAPAALCRYGEALQLVSLTASQSRIERTEMVQVTQTWLCLGDIDRDYGIMTCYRQGNQILFTEQFSLVKLATAEVPMICWRVGELIPLTREITPITMAARARNRLGKGKIDAEIFLQPLSLGHPPPKAMPFTRVPLFVVETANERE